MGAVLFYLLLVGSLAAGIEFVGFVVQKKHIFGRYITRIIGVIVVLCSPWFYLSRADLIAIKKKD